jgi:hypothetical protein
MMELSDALLLSGHAGSSSEIAFLQVGERRVSACAAASSEATDITSRARWPKDTL